MLSTDVPIPLDALSLAVRIALQTSLLPHISIEDIPIDKSYEDRESLIDLRSATRHDQKVFQVDDDWVSPLQRMN